MNRFLLFFALLCLCSCRSSHISSYVSENDTTYIHTINHDSIHTIDSVYIYHNDTTHVVYKSRNNYIYKSSKDTIYKVVRDTIFVANSYSSSSKLPRSTSIYDNKILCAALIIGIVLILLFIFKKFK